MGLKRTVTRYKENPFLAEMVISTRLKQVRVRAMGRDGETSILHHATGELRGTEMVTYHPADDEEFVKLFARNISLTFDLTAAGNKALVLLIWAVQYTAIEKDLIALDSFAHQDFLTKHADKGLKLSMGTFKRGLRELEGAKIIAKSERAGFYFINPSFVFNGDRIAFTKIIERKSANGSPLDLLPQPKGEE